MDGNWYEDHYCDTNSKILGTRTYNTKANAYKFFGKIGITMILLSMIKFIKIRAAKLAYGLFVCWFVCLCPIRQTPGQYLDRAKSASF